MKTSKKPQSIGERLTCGAFDNVSFFGLLGILAMCALIWVYMGAAQ